jgi:hypothetical protein
MLLKIAEFRRRIAIDMDQLVVDLQQLTHRNTFEEEQSWRVSLPKISRAFSDKAFADIDLFLGDSGSLALEYNLPGGTGWADMVLLGRHKQKPAAIIVELKDWVTQGDQPGMAEGLMHRHGRNEGHPSDQVRGYTEWCRNFHSAVQDFGASVDGCVIFTKDPFYHSYNLPPNDKLTVDYPCFSLEKRDVSNRLPDYFRSRLTEPDREFAESFENGVYKQSRGFVQQIGSQILHPDQSPFVLLDNQRLAFALVRTRVAQAVLDNRPKKTVILVEGPPGSGKSVVAAKIWASLAVDKDLPEGNIVVTTTSASQASNWKFLFRKASGNRGASGAVVSATGYTPLSTGQFGSLRKRHPTAFKKEPYWRDNMDMLRSLAPTFRSGSKDNEFLVSIVDEAHALINPEHIEGVGQFGFTTAFGPQAYHIMRASTVTIFLLDARQGFRDRENTTVADIKQWAKELNVEVLEEINLEGSQFRCAGSIEYADWVDSFLEFSRPEAPELVFNEAKANVVPIIYEEPALRDVELAAAETQDIFQAGKHKVVARFAPFQIAIFDTPAEVESALRTQLRKGDTARLLASYAREWKTEGVALPHSLPPDLMDFQELIHDREKTSTWSKIWNFVPNGSDYTHFVQAPIGSMMSIDPLCEVGCPYAVRGFDFDYVGLLWFSDLIWRDGKWTVDPQHVFERGIKRRISAAIRENNTVGPAHANLLRAVQAAYRILLTRPIKGLFIWCEDLETRSHLELSAKTVALRR